MLNVFPFEFCAQFGSVQITPAKCNENENLHKHFREKSNGTDTVPYQKQ